MNRAELEELVVGLVNETFSDDLAEVILEDDAFGALVGRLSRKSDGDPDDMATLLGAVADELEQDTVDWLVDNASNPAAFIASKI